MRVAVFVRSEYSNALVGDGVPRFRRARRTSTAPSVACSSFVCREEPGATWASPPARISFGDSGLLNLHKALAGFKPVQHTECTCWPFWEIEGLCDCEVLLKVERVEGYNEGRCEAAPEFMCKGNLWACNFPSKKAECCTKEEEIHVPEWRPEAALDDGYKPCVEPCYWPALSFATACTTSNIPMLSEKVDLIKDITFSIVLLKLGYHKLSALSICWTISCFGIFLLRADTQGPMLESFTPLLSSLPDTGSPTSYWRSLLAKQVSAARKTTLLFEDIPQAVLALYVVFLQNDDSKFALAMLVLCGVRFVCAFVLEPLVRPCLLDDARAQFWAAQKCENGLVAGSLYAYLRDDIKWDIEWDTRCVELEQLSLDFSGRRMFGGQPWWQAHVQRSKLLAHVQRSKLFSRIGLCANLTALRLSLADNLLSSEIGKPLGERLAANRLRRLDLDLSSNPAFGDEGLALAGGGTVGCEDGRICARRGEHSDALSAPCLAPARVRELLAER